MSKIDCKFSNMTWIFSEWDESPEIVLQTKNVDDSLATLRCEGHGVERVQDTDHFCIINVLLWLVCKQMNQKHLLILKIY